MIKKVIDTDDIKKCDYYLNELIQDEMQYDDSLNENSKVSDYYINNISDNNILLGYYIDDVLVAYTYIKINNDVCFIDALYVETEYRRRGIAKELLNEVFSICKDENIKYIDINVMAKNENAKHLYSLFDFEDFRITMRKELKK